MSRTEAVSVTETEDLAADIDDMRLLEDGDSHFLEIVVAPDVVVPLKEIDLHARVHQVHKRREYTHIALRDHIMIFIPEIPDVAQKVQCFRFILRNRLQELDETRLPCDGILDIQPEMHVRDEIGQCSFFHEGLGEDEYCECSQKAIQ